MLLHEVVRKAKEWYDKNDPGLFETLLVRCTGWGVVIKTPDTFFLAEPVWSDGNQIWYDGEGEPNCWFVHVLVGHLDVGYFKSLVEPTTYFGWERNSERVRDRVRIFKWGNRE